MAEADVTIHRVTAAKAHLLDRVAPGVFDFDVRPELLREFLANPMNHLFVAVAGGNVVGMATGISYVHPDKPLQMFVNEVGVAEPYRRRGIGRRLVEALLAHAEALDCTEAWVATEADNAPALALYRSTGGLEARESVVLFTYKLLQADEGANSS